MVDPRHRAIECATGDKDDLKRPVVSAELPWLKELNIDGEHCTGCHDGWGGVDCGRRYQACDASDPHAPTCFNGGSCYGASTGKYEYMCDCRRWGGRRGAVRGKVLPAHDLECNRSVCAKGFKSYDNFIGTGPFPAALAFNIFSSSGEHYVCPDGCTGLRCEIPVERCRPKEYCYNGSTCAYVFEGPLAPMEKIIR